MPNPRGLVLPPALIPQVLSGEVTVISVPIRPQPPKFGHNGGELRGIVPSTLAGSDLWDCQYQLDNPQAIHCPFHVGQRVYGKEACKRGKLPHLLTGEPTEHETAVYAIDGEPCLEKLGFDLCPWWKGATCPASRMPEYAARIWLEPTSVKAALCSDITEAEAIASGLERTTDPPGWKDIRPGYSGSCWKPEHWFDAWGANWEYLYQRCFSSTWVWRLSVRRCER